MKALRLGLLLAAGLYGFRVVRGRGRMLLARALRPAGIGERVHPHRRRAARGSHPSAASAANDGFRDDRDVVGAVLPGEHRPGAF